MSSSMSPRARLPWPAALLLVSIGLTAVGIVEATRAARSQARVAEGVVRDYARVASWSYEQHLRDALTMGVRELLGPVNHGDNLHTSPRIPEARELVHYLPWNPRCGCHRPAYGPNPAIFFGFTLGSDTLGVGVNTFPRPSEGWEVDQPVPMPMDMGMHADSAASSGRLGGYSAAEARWITDTLTRQIQHGRRNDRFNLVVADREGAPRFLAYTVMPTVRGDTIVYGAEYSRAAVEQVLAGVLYSRDLLPSPFRHGQPITDALQLRVSDAQGTTLFEPRPVARWELDATDTLPASLGGMIVRAQVPVDEAQFLVIGGLPRSRLPFLLALLAISTALAIVAIGQLRRDLELARLRGDFVSSVSHELRTPLAQMRLYLETLRLGRFTTEAQRTSSIELVERETTRLSQLVERVLRFSANGTGDDGTRIPMDVGAEVRRIVDEFRPLAAARRTTLVAGIAEDVPTIRLAPDALRHIVLNLLDNAVKYGPAGQTVRLTLARAGSEVRLTVRDEGAGVAAKDRERIWGAYQRATTPAAVAGSGIGLTIVRDIATRHGGRAWVEEGSSDGATFVVALPLS
jgi:signal transduction histidine kinase